MWSCYTQINKNKKNNKVEGFLVSDSESEKMECGDTESSVLCV